MYNGKGGCGALSMQCLEARAWAPLTTACWQVLRMADLIAVERACSPAGLQQLLLLLLLWNSCAMWKQLLIADCMQQGIA